MSGRGVSNRGGSRGRERATPRDKGKQVASGSGGAPQPNPDPLKFPIKTDEEQERYVDLMGRGVYSPKFIDKAWWDGKAEDGEETAKKFMKWLDDLELGYWAGVKLKAYRGLMLEFFTTVKMNDDGSFTSRFHGIEYETTKKDLRTIFDFDDEEPRLQPRGEFDLMEWWYELAGYRSRKKKDRFEVSKVKSHGTALAYKFFCQVFLGKDDFSRISKAEMAAMWRANKGGHVDLLLLLAERIKQISALSTSKVAKMALGAFVTTLARFHNVRPREGDVEFRPVPMAVGERTFRGATITIPTFRWRAPDPDVVGDHGEVFPDEELHDGDWDGSDEECKTGDTRPRHPGRRKGDGSGPSTRPEVAQAPTASTASWMPSPLQWDMMMDNISSVMESNATILANQGIMMASDQAMSLRLAAVEDDVFEINRNLHYMRWGSPEPDEQPAPQQAAEDEGAGARMDVDESHDH